MTRNKVSDGGGMAEVIAMLDTISGTMESQAQAITTLSVEVGKMGTAMVFYEKQGRKLEKIIESYDERLRDIEIVEAKCTNKTEISVMRDQMDRLVAFMDMIKDKAGEDTAVIDVHAQHMQQAATMTIQDNKDLWKMFVKFGPWLIVAMLAVASVSGFIVAKVVGIDVPVVSLPAKANSSSAEKNKQ